MNQAVKARPTPVIARISESCRQLLSNKATLPSMPDVAARIHTAMSSPNWNISSIAAVIKGNAGTAKGVEPVFLTISVRPLFILAKQAFVLLSQ